MLKNKLVDFLEHWWISFNDLLLDLAKYLDEENILMSASLIDKAIDLLGQLRLGYGDLMRKELRGIE
jgi:hypothetical protein